MRQVDRHDAAEQGRTDDQVRLLAGNVGEARADVAGGELEQVGNQHADTEHPQGFIGLVGDDAIVHVHHVERADQGQHVDDEGGDDDLDVVLLEAPDDLPEPGLAHGVFRQLGAVVLLGFHLDEPAVAKVAGVHLGVGQHFGAAVVTHEGVAALLALALDFGDDFAAAV